MLDHSLPYRITESSTLYSLQWGRCLRRAGFMTSDHGCHDADVAPVRLYGRFFFLGCGGRGGRRSVGYRWVLQAGRATGTAELYGARGGSRCLS